MNNQQPPQKTYKAMLWDYDYLLTKSDDECCYSLSEREVQILLAQIDYIGWKTRYKPTSTEIDQDLIEKWMGNLARKLMSGCCPDDEAIHRYLPDGTFQSSDDDGVTWEDDPAGDPRHGAILAPPLAGLPGDNVRCAAADNVRAQYVIMRDNTVDLLTAGTTLLAIVAGLVALIGGILAISIAGVSFGVILFGLAAALLSLTPESVEEQIDDEALDLFRCIIYCHLDNEGRVTIGGFDNILAQISEQFSDFPESFFYSITASVTATGINNMATMGATDADDCGDCDCQTACGSDWIVTVGSIDSFPDENTIVYSSAPDPGTPGRTTITVSNLTGDGGDDTCCFVPSFTILGASVIFYKVNCDGSSGFGTPQGSCVKAWSVWSNDGIPFTATCQWSGCP